MKDLITFTGGIDFDSDIRNVGEVDYIDALNISSGTSQRGSIHNMYGNKLQDYTLPAGENTCIGTLRNIKQNTIIYFVYNSLGNHSILEYSCAFKVIEPILVPFNLFGVNFTTNFLGFTKENKIHSANILDDILTWTDNNVSPRKINKKRAYDFIRQLPPSATNIPYNNLIATGTDAQKLQFIEFIKYKPEKEPGVKLNYDARRKTNYINDKMIQVMYRYIYDDNEYSRWSDGSYITLPSGSETVNGQTASASFNNNLEVTVNTGHPTVKAIDIAFRFGNTGIWAKLDNPIQKYDEDNQALIGDYVDYVYSFYNDSVLIELPMQVDNYDSVPQISKTQEIIDGNRQVFANNVEGYENPSQMEVEITSSDERTYLGESQYIMNVNAEGFAYTNTNYGTPSPDYVYARLSIPAVKPTFMDVGVVVFFTVNRFTDTPMPPPFYGSSTDISYAVTANDLLNWPVNITNSLGQAVKSISQPIKLFYGIDPANGSGNIAIDLFPLGVSTENARISNAKILPIVKKNMSYKKGAYHAFGIVYKDAQGRDGGVATYDPMNLYVPYLSESRPGVNIDNNYGFITSAQMSISHKPPVWAKQYEIVYATSNIQKFTQFSIKGGGVTGPDANGNMSIDCTYIIDYITKERVINSVDFQFEIGDRIRFISNRFYYVSNYIECSVLAFDTTTNILTVAPYNMYEVMAGMATQTQEETLCELFSIKKQTSLVNRPYFAIGETYDILNPGTPQRAHQGNTQNQTSTIPAIVSLNRGDCYIYKRYFDHTNIVTVVESENFSDFYASKNIDISAIYAVIPEGKTKRYEQGLRYGGRYFPNTNTNDLCQFNGSDYDTVNTRYGPINKIASVGYTLKVLQTKKNTSIYIDRNMIFNANGESQLTLTDKVLGNKNPSELDYGCDHPESVCVDDRHMYFFDVNTGTFIQDAANGMMPISDYKAKTYFRNIAQKIKDSSNVYVYCSMDVFNAYLNVTFIDVTGNIIPNQTIAYHTPDNKWKTKLSYTPEYYGSNALTFVSFKDGALWEHNDQTVARNNFYGTQYSTKVKFVANTDYLTIKNFASVAIYSNKLWSSPEIGSITVPASTGYATGMSSRLLPAKFRWKESVAYADYLRDANTPNFPTQEAALMGGRKLRGQVLIQEVENSDTDETVLYSVLVTSVPSPLSK